MNNLQFIATYIDKNPGAKYSEIIRNLMLWKGFSAFEIVRIGGQYSRYFTQYPSNGPSYNPMLWKKTNPNNKKSGYKLTPIGKTYIVKGA